MASQPLCVRVLFWQVNSEARGRNCRMSFAFIYPDRNGRNVMRQFACGACKCTYVCTLCGQGSGLMGVYLFAAVKKCNDLCCLRKKAQCLCLPTALLEGRMLIAVIALHPVQTVP
eukprot:1147684-Pelagomonas_calceolata.AAC.1